MTTKITIPAKNVSSFLNLKEQAMQAFKEPLVKIIEQWNFIPGPHHNLDVYFVARLTDGKPDKEIHSGRDLNKLLVAP